MIVGAEAHRLLRPVRRTLDNTPRLNGWWSSITDAVSDAGDWVSEKTRDVGHVVATGIRAVPGGSYVTSAVGTTYSLATDVTDAIGIAVKDIGDFLERMIRPAVRSAVRPIVNQFKGDSPFFLGAEDPTSVEAHLKAAKAEIVAAATAAATAAGAAVGSAVPGVGTAAGGAAGAAMTPSVVSEIIDEIVSSAKSIKTSTSGAVKTTAQATGTDDTTVYLVGAGVLAAFLLWRK